jgi:hypothetical protein
MQSHPLMWESNLSHLSRSIFASRNGPSCSVVVQAKNRNIVATRLVTMAMAVNFLLPV